MASCSAQQRSIASVSFPRADLIMPPPNAKLTDDEERGKGVRPARCG